MEAIAAGPSGTLWFTDDSDDSSSRITTNGLVRIYHDKRVANPAGITLAPESALWFASHRQFGS